MITEEIYIRNITTENSNLTILPSPIEDISLDLSHVGTIVLLFVHSHASLKASLASIKKNKEAVIHAISLPCCQEDDLGISPYSEWEDHSILSVHRTLRLYKNI